MGKCPRCGSKEIKAVFYGNPSPIIQRKLDAGDMVWGDENDPAKPNLCCDVCKFRWTAGMLPAEYIKKIRFKVETLDEYFTKLGDRVIDVSPNGKVAITIHFGNDNNAAAKASGMLSVDTVASLYELVLSFREEAGHMYNTETGVRYFAKVSYMDDYKTDIAGDGENGEIYSCLFDLLREMPDVSALVDIPFPGSEVVANPELDKSYSPTDNKELLYTGKDIYYLTARKILAYGKFVKDGFLVLAGSQFAMTETKSILQGVHDERALHLESGIIENGVLTKDLLFRSHARACAVMSGGLGDGKGLWKNRKGRSIGDLDAHYVDPSEEAGPVAEDQPEAVDTEIVDEPLVTCGATRQAILNCFQDFESDEAEEAAIDDVTICIIDDIYEDRRLIMPVIISARSKKEMKALNISPEGVFAALPEGGYIHQVVKDGKKQWLVAFADSEEIEGATGAFLLVPVAEAFQLVLEKNKYEGIAVQAGEYSFCITRDFCEEMLSDSE